MGKFWVEVCLISARGLRRPYSSLLKLQWYAVGWIDPNNKYCTQLVSSSSSSGNANPVWKTKFATLIQYNGSASDESTQDLALHVEVYSREPIFLRETLQGSATIILREFLAKQVKIDSDCQEEEEVVSYQLRRRNSNKPRGFVDVSIRISEEGGKPKPYQGDNDGGFTHNYYGSDTISLNTQIATGQAFNPPQLHLIPAKNPPYSSHPIPYPTSHSHTTYGGGPSYPSAASYQPPRSTPPLPPPPPPAHPHVGYIPTYLPGTGGSNQHTYINMPSSGPASAQRAPAGLVVGLGAGALGAGAVMFGGDFMSGLDVPAGLQDPNIAVSIDPPF